MRVRALRGLDWGSRTSSFALFFLLGTLLFVLCINLSILPLSSSLQSNRIAQAFGLSNLLLYSFSLYASFLLLVTYILMGIPTSITYSVDYRRTWTLSLVYVWQNSHKCFRFRSYLFLLLLQCNAQANRSTLQPSVFVPIVLFNLVAASVVLGMGALAKVIHRFNLLSDIQFSGTNTL